jgi:hypothetical protein
VSVQRFKATPVPRGKGAAITLPFDPNLVWGEMERFNVRGSIAGNKFRGTISRNGNSYELRLGPSWVRDNQSMSEAMDVALELEGPQLADDFAAALEASPEAKAYFNSIATFYRKGYVNWIESAKRPETRARRVAEAIVLLAKGIRQR